MIDSIYEGIFNHAEIMATLEEVWELLNWNGILGYFLTFCCLYGIYRVVGNMFSSDGPDGIEVSE